MRLLMLSLDFPPNDGGISRLASGIASALAAKAEAPLIVSFATTDCTDSARPGARCVGVSRRKGLRDVQIVKAVRAYLRDAHGRDELPVLTTVWNPEATLALLAGARRVSILAHGNEVMPYRSAGLALALKARLRRFVLERARMIICNSSFTEGLVHEIAPRARTVVLHPAVDAGAFRPQMSRTSARIELDLPAELRVILTVARLDPMKGHETVLRSIALLPFEARSRLLYVIVGKGEMGRQLAGLAVELGIEPHVRFAGFVADEDLPLWYAAADLFALTSIVDPARRGMEGFGMVLTEAQAAGLPVIGTRSGGIPDAVVEGEGGWLIEERDAEALAGHLAALVSDPFRFTIEGARAATRVRRDMNWADYVERLRALV